MLCIVDPRLTHPVFTQLQSGDILSFDLVAKTLKARHPSLEAGAYLAFCDEGDFSNLDDKRFLGFISDKVSFFTYTTTLGELLGLRSRNTDKNGRTHNNSVEVVMKGISER
jgi:hypothetical protein